MKLYGNCMKLYGNCMKLYGNCMNYMEIVLSCY